MDKVYGAYLCTGCGIGEVLDVDGLKSVADETGIAMQSRGVSYFYVWFFRGTPIYTQLVF